MQEWCGEAFPDVMDYVVCEKCGTMFCEDCMNVYGLEDKEVTEESCPFCSGKEIDSDEFLNWLIEYKKECRKNMGEYIYEKQTKI